MGILWFGLIIDLKWFDVNLTGFLELLGAKLVKENNQQWEVDYFPKAACPKVFYYQWLQSYLL